MRATTCKRVGQNELVFGMPHGEHRARREAHDLLGDAAHHQVCHGAAAMGAHDDDVDVCQLRLAGDFQCGRTACADHGHGVELPPIFQGDQLIKVCLCGWPRGRPANGRRRRPPSRDQPRAWGFQRRAARAVWRRTCAQIPGRRASAEADASPKSVATRTLAILIMIVTSASVQHTTCHTRLSALPRVRATRVFLSGRCRGEFSARLRDLPQRWSDVPCGRAVALMISRTFRKA